MRRSRDDGEGVVGAYLCTIFLVMVIDWCLGSAVIVTETEKNETQTHTHKQDLFELFGIALPVSGIGGLCFNLAGAAIFGDPSGENRSTRSECLQ